jgi:hypothetical protein
LICFNIQNPFPKFHFPKFLGFQFSLKSLQICCILTNFLSYLLISFNHQNPFSNIPLSQVWCGFEFRVFFFLEPLQIYYCLGFKSVFVREILRLVDKVIILGILDKILVNIFWIVKI